MYYLFDAAPRDAHSGTSISLWGCQEETLLFEKLKKYFFPHFSVFTTFETQDIDITQHTHISLDAAP